MIETCIPVNLIQLTLDIGIGICILVAIFCFIMLVINLIKLSSMK